MASTRRAWKAWKAVGTLAKMKDVSVERRLQTLRKFLADFPKNNPYSVDAQRYISLLEKGKEPYN